MRNIKPRVEQPVLPPKNKVLRTPAPGEDELPVVYAPAKLREDVLNHSKVYCAMHKLQMQEFVSEAVELRLTQLGYLPLPVRE